MTQRRRYRQWADRHREDAEFVFARPVYWKGKTYRPTDPIPQSLLKGWRHVKLFKLFKRGRIHLVSVALDLGQDQAVEQPQPNGNGAPLPDLPEGHRVEHSGIAWYTFFDPDGSENRVQGRQAAEEYAASLWPDEEGESDGSA